MKTPFKPSYPAVIEILEARIAPALLTYGANLFGGAGNPTSGEQSVGPDHVTLVTVTSGQALVYYQAGKIYGISAGPGAVIDVFGNIDGDVVGNLGANGLLSDADGNAANGRDGGLLLANNFKLTVHSTPSNYGNINNVITGGSIVGLNVDGVIKGIYAGDGVFHSQSDLGNSGSFNVVVGGPGPEYSDLDLNPVIAGQQSFFSFSNTVAQKQLIAPSASILNTVLNEGFELQVIAGSGSPTGAASATAGAPGGSISAFSIVDAGFTFGVVPATPSYALYAGAGGDGKTGGAGGGISSVAEKASEGDVVLTAGKGGAGLGGAGGVGGSVRSLDMKSQVSKFTVTAGDGGQGSPAGAGGSIANNNFADVAKTASLIQGGDIDGDGSDDVVVLNTGSGELVVERNQGNGTNFTPLIQHGGESIIKSSGVGASDLDLADINFDNDLDIVVTYAGSSEVIIYINQGGGIFWKNDLAGYDTYQSSYTLSGTLAQTVVINSTVYTTANQSVTEAFIVYMPRETGSSSPEVVGIVPGKVASFETFDGSSYLGLETGSLYAFSGAFSGETEITLSGAIISLDFSDDGNSLLAMSKGNELQLIDITAPSGPFTVQTSITLPNGVPQKAMFLKDYDPLTQDPVAALSIRGNLARVDTFDPVGVPVTSYTDGVTLTSPDIFRQFTDVKSIDGTIGIAAVTSSLGEFGFSNNLAAFVGYSLPFAGKEIYLYAGNGGNGVDVGTLLGKGGVGGSIVGLNAEAVLLLMRAGDGGLSQTGAAGGGGSVANSTALTTYKSGILSPTLSVQDYITITVGTAGSPTGIGPMASGGDGGNVSGLNILAEGAMVLTAGDGGDGNGGAGGKGGSISGLHIKSSGVGAATFLAGRGGDAPLAIPGAKPVTGGAGGSISGIKYNRDLNVEAELKEQSDTFTFISGNGGISGGGNGGAGGNVTSINLLIDTPDTTDDEFGGGSVVYPYTDAEIDSTFKLFVQTGLGGNGAIGGAGGNLKAFKFKAVTDQQIDLGIIIGGITAQFLGGNGGTGLTGNGGAGGTLDFSSNLAGLTFSDPDAAFEFPLVAVAGSGGNGALKGGPGGSVKSLITPNAPLFSGEPITSTHLTGAIFIGGNGGVGTASDGGKGGDISGIITGVEGLQLVAAAGQGGNGVKGGSGGGVLNSTFGLVDFNGIAFDAGLLITGGSGGAGVSLGGSGGILSKLTVHVPVSTTGAPAILTAGEGGAASGAGGVGGKGGDISGISNSKDVFGIVSLIEAGNGGAAPLGRGGAGGNVMTIKIAGYVGRPSLGAFDTSVIPGSYNGIMQTDLTNGLAQGLYVGRGGVGATEGVNGYIKTVSTSAIAAVAAAVNSTGHFGVVSAVTSLATDFIGYDLAGNGTFDSTSGQTSPSMAIPIDGFILARNITKTTGVIPGYSFSA